MLRRRGSAPAVVLQQHITEPKGVLCKADRISSSPDASKLSKTSSRKKDQLERSCSPPSLALCDRRTNTEMNHGVEYCESAPPKCPSPALPGSPNLNVKSMRHRMKRRDSEPVVSQVPNGSINSRNSPSSLQRRSSSFRDYNIVLLGQGGVGKSGG